MLRVVGLMSGTSADGMDAALCEIDGAPPKITARIMRAKLIPYEPSLREKILMAMQRGAADAEAICRLNFAVGEAFAAAALDVLEGESADVIGSHGQTLWHQVEPDGTVSATLQIGDGSVIAERTGITTINNFRARDVAAGGQGAPLAGYQDWLLLRHPTEWRAVQNIGGIGNVTFLPPLNQSDAPQLAFDTGPGNALIDSAITILSGGRLTYDEGGQLAARGRVVSTWLEELLEHPYFAAPLPKTTGREIFGTEYAAELVNFGRARGFNDADILATITQVTAYSIAAAYRAFAPAPISECIVAGGGRLNNTLMSALEKLLAPTRVSRSEDHGIDGDFKEAMLFALLAYETIHHRVGCLPSQTGARHASVLGQITPAANFTELIRASLNL
ncbi:MAG: anhydro-N-acetylmuramic acid kinase [Anaerolineae bacterium]